MDLKTIQSNLKNWTSACRISIVSAPPTVFRRSSFYTSREERKRERNSLFKSYFLPKKSFENQRGYSSTAISRKEVEIPVSFPKTQLIIENKRRNLFVSSKHQSCGLSWQTHLG